MRGPIVHVMVWASAPMRKLLLREGKLVPQPIRLELLIDTGADTTTLNEMHMRSMALPVRGATEVRGITSESRATECNTYDVELQLINSAGDPPLILPVVEVIGRPFHNEVIDGVIGRDFLSNVNFDLQGPLRQFAIHY